MNSIKVTHSTYTISMNLIQTFYIITNVNMIYNIQQMIQLDYNMQILKYYIKQYLMDLYITIHRNNHMILIM